jgi:hypothetical protein
MSDFTNNNPDVGEYQLDHEHSSDGADEVFHWRQNNKTWWEKLENHVAAKESGRWSR